MKHLQPRGSRNPKAAQTFDQFDHPARSFTVHPLKKYHFPEYICSACGQCWIECTSKGFFLLSLQKKYPSLRKSLPDKDAAITKSVIVAWVDCITYQDFLDFLNGVVLFGSHDAGRMTTSEGTTYWHSWKCETRSLPFVHEVVGVRKVRVNYIAIMTRSSFLLPRVAGAHRWRLIRSWFIMRRLTYWFQGDAFQSHNQQVIQCMISVALTIRKLVRQVNSHPCNTSVQPDSYIFTRQTKLTCLLILLIYIGRIQRRRILPVKKIIETLYQCIIMMDAHVSALQFCFSWAQCRPLNRINHHTGHELCVRTRTFREISLGSTSGWWLIRLKTAFYFVSQ